MTNSEIAQVVKIVLDELLSSSDDTISQADAWRILSRRQVDNGMKDGSIRWSKVKMNSDLTSDRVSLSDVMKIKYKNKIKSMLVSPIKLQ